MKARRSLIQSLKSLFANLLWAIVHTRLGQWVSMKFTGGWCFVKKDDPRFIVTALAYALKYAGDPNAAPDKGVSNQRKQWKTWVVFRIPQIFGGNFIGHVFIDIHGGRRMAHLGYTNDVVAIRAGHEMGVIRLGLDCSEPFWRGAQPESIAAQYMAVASTHKTLKPEFLVRWKEGTDWPAEAVGRPQYQVTFI